MFALRQLLEASILLALTLRNVDMLSFQQNGLTEIQSIHTLIVVLICCKISSRA